MLASKTDGVLAPINADFPGTVIDKTTPINARGAPREVEPVCVYDPIVENTSGTVAAAPTLSKDPPAITVTAASTSVTDNVTATLADASSLPSPLENLEEKKSTTRKAINAAPEEKVVARRKSESKKKAIELVVQEDNDIQNTSQMISLKDENSPRNPKEQQPKSSANPSRRQPKEEPESSNSANIRRLPSRRSHLEKKAVFGDEDDGNSEDDIVVNLDISLAKETNDDQEKEENMTQFQHYFEHADSFLVDENFRVSSTKLTFDILKN